MNADFDLNNVSKLKIAIVLTLLYVKQSYNQNFILFTYGENE